MDQLSYIHLVHRMNLITDLMILQVLIPYLNPNGRLEVVETTESGSTGADAISWPLTLRNGNNDSARCWNGRWN